MTAVPDELAAWARGEPHLNACPRVEKMFKLQWEAVQQAWVLLYPEGMVKLNASAGEIMSRLDGKTSIETLIRTLEQQFETKNLQADVLDFLTIAKRQGWVKI